MGIFDRFRKEKAAPAPEMSAEKAAITPMPANSYKRGGSIEETIQNAIDAAQLHGRPVRIPGIAGVENMIVDNQSNLDSALGTFRAASHAAREMEKTGQVGLVGNVVFSSPEHLRLNAATAQYNSTSNDPAAIRDRTDPVSLANSNLNLADLKLTQIDGDTFRTQPLTEGQRDRVFSQLRDNGIDVNAHTRPRDVPVEDRFHPQYHAQAAFVSASGEIKMDKSVVDQMADKGITPPIKPSPQFAAQQQVQSAGIGNNIRAGMDAPPSAQNQGAGQQQQRGGRG